jgi:D-lactate dehydrogenase
MKTAFFEVQEWEQELLKQHFPDATQDSGKLTAENVGRFADAEIVSTFIYSGLSASLIDQLPNLRLIVTRSTGFDHIDLKHCQAKNIAVCNVPEYGSNTVAEHTFALILSLTRRIYQSVNQAKTLNFDHRAIQGEDLFGKTIGIIGLGKIGQNVARIASGFGMKVLAYDATTSGSPEQIAYVDLATLLAGSDIVSIHLPLVPETKHFINKNNITQFKRGSYLINTARGGLVETEAILVGINQGILAGAALDVLEEEKELAEEAIILTPEYRDKVNMQNLLFNHMLINHPKVLITPHNAFNSREALGRIVETTAANIGAFLDGRPVNLVS